METSRLSRRGWFRAAATLGLAASGTAGFTFATESEKRRAKDVLDIGTRKQLFIDDRFIVESKGVGLELNRPDLQWENLLTAEKPWELGIACARGSICQHGGKTMLWYQAGEWDESRAIVLNTRRMCYAESMDGIHFTKPELGLIEFHGSKRNNIVTVGAEGHMFLDEHDTPDRRFKAIMDMRPNLKTLRWPPAEGVARHSIYLFSSPDGIHWTRSRNVVFPMYLGAEQSAIWDNRLDKWVLYLRAHRPHRCFGRVEIEAGRLHEPYPFQPLEGRRYDQPGEVTLTTELPIVMDRDERDPPGAQPYLMNAWKYPGAEDVYFAYVPMWYDARGRTPASDMLEVQLAISRDGIDWKRPWRHALISPGAPDYPEGGQVWPLMDPVIRNNQIWLYYLAQPERHMQGPQRSGVVRRAIWGLDRFVAAQAGPGSGHIVTPTLRFAGNAFAVNLDAGASGRLRVGVEKPNGQAIKGFSLDECHPVYGNGVALTVRWKGEANVKRLVGQPVRLRFVMRNAKLYSFQFLP